MVLTFLKMKALMEKNYLQLSGENVLFYAKAGFKLS